MTDPSRSTGETRLRAAAAEAGYAALFAGVFLALGAQIAFFQLFLEGRGFDAAAIGALNIVAVAVRIVAGAALPAVAEWSGRPRRAMALIALIGALASALHLFATATWTYYLLASIAGAAFAGVMPLADALAYREAKRRAFSYRRARSVGSIAFLAATFVIGDVVAAFGRDAVMIWIAAALLFAAIGALLAPVTQPSLGAEAEEKGSTRPNAFFAAWLQLARNRRFLLFLAIAGALQASHAVYYVYGSYNWSAQGFSDPVIGRLWAFGVFVEILLFLFGGRLLDRLTPERALAIAGAAGLARWGAMAAEPGLQATIGLQALHGATFGLAHLAALAFIARAAPPALAASAQGLMSAVSGGVAMLLATMAATALYPAVGAGAYLSSAALSGLGALLCLWLTTPKAPFGRR